MERVKNIRRASPRSVTATSILALLLVICLAESATGSCLSYGHSCWGAHGKRSGKPPMTAPDWYLTKMLRRMASNPEQPGERQNAKYDDINAIFKVDVADNLPAAEKSDKNNEDRSLVVDFPRNPDAKPMLDDELLSNIKLWQMMREASDKK